MLLDSTIIYGGSLTQKKIVLYSSFQHSLVSNTYDLFFCFRARLHSTRHPLDFPLTFWLLAGWGAIFHFIFSYIHPIQCYVIDFYSIQD